VITLLEEKKAVIYEHSKIIELRNDKVVAFNALGFKLLRGA